MNFSFPEAAQWIGGATHTLHPVGVRGARARCGLRSGARPPGSAAGDPARCPGWEPGRTMRTGRAGRCAAATLRVGPCRAAMRRGAARRRPPPRSTNGADWGGSPQLGASPATVLIRPAVGRAGRPPRDAARRAAALAARSPSAAGSMASAGAPALYARYPGPWRATGRRRRPSPEPPVESAERSSGQLLEPATGGWSRRAPPEQPTWTAEPPALSRCHTCT